MACTQWGSSFEAGDGRTGLKAGSRAEDEDDWEWTMAFMKDAFA